DRIAWYFNANYPWLGMLFCAPIIGLWYWTTDQYIVQRALSARDEREARRGAIFAATLKLLPLFLFIVPGMIALALAKAGRLPGLVDAESAYPLLVTELLPVGVRGLVVAGLLAALMSSLAGVFAASSTLFTIDLYERLRPRATQHRLVWVGRLATTAMVAISLLWIPVIRGSRGLYDYLQGVQGYLAPPIFAAFFLGVFVPRVNAAGCLAGLAVGFGLGVFRLAVDTPVTLGLWGEGVGYAAGSFLWIVNNVYFQYYSLLIFAVSVGVMLAVSFATPPPAEAQLAGLTRATVSADERAASRASWNRWDVLSSAAVLVAIGLVYASFRG
ncbi:MAG: sodium/solute symporter, partial [Myxococcota bacterium]